MKTRLGPWLAVLLLIAGSALADDARVRRVDIRMEPYYVAAGEPGGKPTVNVSKTFDRLLASNDPSDIVRARDLIAADSENITPMTLMVLAIRLYDVGLRDDAVFWYYVARNRFILTTRVADMQSPEMGDVDRAMKEFILRAGQVINGYAGCDIEKQKATSARSVKWVIDNQYTALLDPQVPAQPGDRKDNLRKAYNELMGVLAKEQQYLSRMPNIEAIRRQRDRDNLDVKYCWKN